MKALTISQTTPPPPMNIPFKSKASLVRVTAQLHLFDAVEGVFMLQEENATASVIETGPWECICPLILFLMFSADWLSVSTPQKKWISQRMEAEMNPVFNYVHCPGYLPFTPAGTPFFHLELL